MRYILTEEEFEALKRPSGEVNMKLGELKKFLRFSSAKKSSDDLGRPVLMVKYTTDEDNWPVEVLRQIEKYERSGEDQ